MNVRGVIFTGGGEPFVNIHTPEMINHANNIGLDVGVITNGQLLNKTRNETILKNAKWCRVSLDSGTPEMYKQTHGMKEKDFYQTTSNIKQLTDMKKELGSKTTIGTAYLTGKNTLEGMLDFVKLSKDLGVDYAQFRPFHKDFTPIDKQLNKIKKYEDSNFKITHSKHKYDHFNDSNKRPYSQCYGVNFASVIGADSNVYLCCHMRGNEKYSLGNLKENTLEDIWNSERKKEVFNNIDFKDCPPFCRCDTFNRILYDIKQNKKHKNFL